jgi:hypothetical protein
MGVGGYTVWIAWAPIGVDDAKRQVAGKDFGPFTSIASADDEDGRMARARFQFCGEARIVAPGSKVISTGRQELFNLHDGFIAPHILHQHF